MNFIKEMKFKISKSSIRNERHQGDKVRVVLKIQDEEFSVRTKSSFELS
ncbi:hypothetical protein ACIQ34_01535 [Ureibacillus sp. NPDC094379]